MLHTVCSWQHLMGNYASQTRDQYLVVLPQVNVNFQPVDFEWVVEQLKDVVRDFSKAFFSLSFYLICVLSCMDNYAYFRCVLYVVGVSRFS